MPLEIKVEKNFLFYCFFYKFELLALFTLFAAKICQEMPKDQCYGFYFTSSSGQLLSKATLLFVYKMSQTESVFSKEAAS